VIEGSELISRVCLTSVLGVGPRMFETLLLTFGSAEAVFEAPFPAFSRIPRFSRKHFAELHSIDREVIAQLIENWRRQGIAIAVKGSDGYPEQLALQPDAPPIIFGSRRWKESGGGIFAIVGSRQATKACCFFAEHLAMSLAAKGITVISGMAVGIDRSAHWGALKAGGPTVAVLGNGILIPFPPANRDLYEAILSKGLVLSEQLPTTAPNAGSLIARNRIIAGIADMTMVIEAQRRGGSIETGMKTLNMSKKLLVYDINASGNRFLIRQGGIPVRNVQNVFDYIGSADREEELLQ